MMKFACKAIALSVMAAMSTFALAEDSKLPFPGEVTGNISAVPAIIYVALPMHLKIVVQLYRVDWTMATMVSI